MKNDIKHIYSLFKNSSGISIDTRSVGQNNLFFALKGDNFNGNLFALKAIETGASFAIIDKKQEKQDDCLILVDDVLTCLQELAAYHRQQLDITIIGITGTNGKTTTKELINCVLSAKFNVLATKGNLNNHIGVPLTLLSISEKHEIGIIEMGANAIGEIEMLCNLAKPNLGLITNIGKAHLEGFGNFDGVIKAKSEMYEHMKSGSKKIFINQDNSLLLELASELDKISYGESSEATYSAKANVVEDEVSVLLNDNENETEIKTHLIGKYNFENVMCAIAIGQYFEVNFQSISKAISSYVPTNNRSQIVETATNRILLDAYNANPSSMNLSIHSFINQDSKEKYFFLGDMMELGQYSDAEHQNIVDLLVENNINNAVLIGNAFAKTNTPNHFNLFTNREEVIVWLKENPVSNGAILIKGSRSMKLEELVDSL
ncbi:MAG: UDP-N-acetylmuramoyl-tripeptide--D-alanyl-D-alanine ligase [Flavobacteriales bacterium]|nr:UDP-N-acetylmuramoyl-tripeptide--D-alanyl-D-alanine ligase [Flavobacteriales bacterium]